MSTYLRRLFCESECGTKFWSVINVNKCLNYRLLNYIRFIHVKESTPFLGKKIRTVLYILVLTLLPLAPYISLL